MKFTRITKQKTNLNFTNKALYVTAPQTKWINRLIVTIKPSHSYLAIGLLLAKIV